MFVGEKNLVIQIWWIDPPLEFTAVTSIIIDRQKPVKLDEIVLQEFREQISKTRKMGSVKLKCKTIAKT